MNFYSLFTKWFMIFAAGSLHFRVTKFDYVAVYWRLGVCGLGCCSVCAKPDCVLAGSKRFFLFPLVSNGESAIVVWLRWK